MSDIPQLLAAIDHRLAELAAEITTLTAAKAALERPPTVGRRPARATPARSRPSRPRRTRSPKATERAASKTTAGVAVGANMLERLLTDSTAGLSASAIAAQLDSAYNPTLKLLRELETAGQVRRSGSRRTTVWRLITDEQRIAERAAELERSASLPRQRRAKATAS